MKEDDEPMKYRLFFLLALPLIMLGLKTTAHADRAVPVVDSLELGRLNAVKKAHQMTDLEFVPLSSFKANGDKTYEAGKKYKGLLYSSVKETNTFVGMDVSFHTFMTALHNLKSVLYTEDVSKLPYHGVKCGAYYGTVCSGLVNYALGLDIYIRSYEIPQVECMELVSDQSAKGLEVADVLWKKGHVAMVTGIWKDPKGKIMRIEICQAQHGGSRRSYKNSSEAFNEMLAKGKWKIYRYKELKKNTTYTPLTQFVAVDGEEKTSFVYNDDICANKGDKSCYIVGENVVLNVAKGSKKVEIYKNATLYKTVDIDNTLDVVLENLSYGDYKARVVRGKNKSEFTYWKVIEVNVSFDKKNSRIVFSSRNSIPVYLEFCNLSGSSLAKNVYAISEYDVKNGYKRVIIPQLKDYRKKSFPSYLKVHFECEYGRVINKPINWK